MPETNAPEHHPPRRYSARLEHCWLPVSMPGAVCVTCRTSPGTPTPAKRAAMTAPEARSTETPPRDVDPATLARIDAAAQRAGLSRSVLLRELLARYADEQQSGALTDQQVEAFGSSVRDLLDGDTRAAAWRR